jgi:hypothetical protein
MAYARRIHTVGTCRRELPTEVAFGLAKLDEDSL